MEGRLTGVGDELDHIRIQESLLQPQHKQQQSITTKATRSNEEKSHKAGVQ